ncbi:MAG: transposase, partial [Dehalococcoidia bacterium]
MARRKARQGHLFKQGFPLYNCSVGIKRTKHAVYDLKYHLVWIPKYTKNILSKEVSEYLKVIFNKIAEEYDFR